MRPFQTEASLLCTAAALLLLGCSGEIRPAGGGAKPVVPLAPGEAAAPLYTCDAAQAPPELPLPRLSRTELENTLRFAISLGNPGQAANIWTQVSSSFANYPPDQRTPAPGDLRGGYDRFDQSIQQLAIDASYVTAEAIGKQLTSSTTRMGTLMGTCATDASTTNDRTCLEAFIKRWASRVMRYPLTAADVTYYADVTGGTPVSPAAVADVIAMVLASPETLYRVEHGTADGQAQAPLSAHELAARLSYQYWQSPPDDELWAAAQSGALLDPATYDAQVRRLVASPNARGVVDGFVRQWLRLDELPPLDTLSDDAAFQAFAGAQLPPDTARDAMIGDVVDSWWQTMAAGGTASDFLGDRRSYATDDYLASIYGVEPWSGTGPAPLVPSAKRSGLLTRAALLATGTVGTRPIHKGYLVRNALLCQQLGAPPPNVTNVPPKSTGTLTTRESVTALTGNGACGGCHTSQINPAGFLTESFDALGRERAEERVFDAEGNLLASLAIRTAAVPEVSPGDHRELADAVELTRVIDETRLYHSCLATHYARYSLRRPEVARTDGCLLSELESKAREGAPLQDVLRAVAHAPAFKAKRFE